MQHILNEISFVGAVCFYRITRTSPINELYRSVLNEEKINNYLRHEFCRDGVPKFHDSSLTDS